MSGPPGGSEAHENRDRQTPERTDDSGGCDYPRDLGCLGFKNSPFFPPLSPSDPARQAKRLPLRILKMLTAHSGHMLHHPEYLQPLSSAPVSIELDAKKSPLALLAQTCSQIGKPDPPPTKLGSVGSGGQSDKEALARPSGPALKLGEHRLAQEDKSSFKPYSKVGGDCRKEGGGAGGVVIGADKAGFRLAGGGVGGGVGGGAPCQPFPPHAASPNSKAGSPPLHPQSPANAAHAQHLVAPPPLHSDPKPGAPDPARPDSAGGGNPKKEAESCRRTPDSAHIASAAHAANSAHVRAVANASSGSSVASPRPHEGKADAPPPHHVAPVSPFKQSHALFPLGPSGMGYHGSVVGAYAGYPSPFVSGLEHAKAGLAGGLAGGGAMGKHPSSSPLTGASPPSFMQGLCRDPYCLTYAASPHLGGGACTSCAHDPSSPLKPAGFPLVYPGHPLHSLHPGPAHQLSHPLYGFMLPSEPLPHACNWVSAGGPCDKRFGSSEELLAHLRTHTALPGGSDGGGGKLLSAYASPATTCHLHLPSQGSPAPLASSFSLRAPPGLSFARYHPYGKMNLPASHSLPLPSLPASSPFYSPYALYGQRLGSASALGYP